MRESRQCLCGQLDSKAASIHSKAKCQSIFCPGVQIEIEGITVCPAELDICALVRYRAFFGTPLFPI